jgi:5'-methylthioinosine phosphorylase
MRVGVIGGTGFYRLDGAESLPVSTPYGETHVSVRKARGRTVFFLPRHGGEHQLPPHRVNHRANVAALAACGVERIVAINTVGSIHREWPAGTLVVPHDFVDFSGRAATFFDDEAVHVDMTAPYCPEVRAALFRGGKTVAKRPSKARGNGVSNEAKVPPIVDGVYACTQGPRLETPAEIRLLAQVADVVGMTGFPEVVLAREKGICYASLCVVSNPAAGLVKSLPIRDVIRNAKRSEARVRDVVERAVEALPAKRACGCRRAVEKARLR